MSPLILFIMANWKDYANAALFNPGALIPGFSDMHGFETGDSYSNNIDMITGAGYNPDNYTGYSGNPYADAVSSGLYDDFAPFWGTAKRGRAMVDAMLELQSQYNLMDYQTGNQMSLMAYQDQLTNPVRQAQLMRAAGVNPDLAGIDGSSVSGGSAAGGTAPKIEEENLPFGDVGQAFSMASTFMGAAGGLFKNIASAAELLSRIPVNESEAGLKHALMTNEQLKSLGIETQNRINEFGLNASLGRLARQIAPYINDGQQLDLSLLGLTDEQMSIFEGYMDIFRDSDIVAAEKSDAVTKIDDNATQRSTNEATRIGNDIAVARAMANPWYDSNREVMISALRPVQNMYFHLQLKDQELQSAIKEFETNYYRLRSPWRKAQAENSADMAVTAEYTANDAYDVWAVRAEEEALVKTLSTQLFRVTNDIEKYKNTLIRDLWSQMTPDNIPQIYSVIHLLSTGEFGERKINYILKTANQGADVLYKTLMSLGYALDVGGGLMTKGLSKSVPKKYNNNPSAVPGNPTYREFFSDPGFSFSF